MKLENIFGAFVFLALAAFFYKITAVILGLILIVVLCLFVSDYLRDRRIRRFRKMHEGKYFLWYSSRKEFKELIESQLKPLFHVEYTIVYNNKNTIESCLSDEQLRYLRSGSERLKLPLMMRIGKDNVYTESFHQEISQYKYNKIDREEFHKCVNTKLKKLK